MRLMLDSNIVISATLFPTGRVAALLAEIAASHKIHLCAFAIDEMRRVFQRKFPASLPKLEAFLATQSYELHPSPCPVPANVPPLADENDRLILAAAIQSGMDVLLTGDRDFSGLGLERPQILTPAEFRAAYL